MVFSKTLWWISIASTPAAFVRRHCASKSFLNDGIVGVIARRREAIAEVARRPVADAHA